MLISLLINFSYLVASLCFVIGLKMLSSPASAKKGNLLSAIGMLLAVVVTLLDKQIIAYHWIVIGLVIGSAIGMIMAKKVAMTSMPEMVALLNGFGGAASLLVGASAFLTDPHITLFVVITVYLSILIGGVTFSGSVVAWAKLSEYLPGKPLLFRGQKTVNILLLLALLAIGYLFSLNFHLGLPLMIATTIGSLLLGILVVIPIGGADMPVVISLLNSYSGIAGCAAGFVIQNNVLIVSGALVGASGIILSSLMCKAMNRSLSHVLFSGFGGAVSASKKIEGEITALSPQDAYHVLEAAHSVVIVPGYGLAVAQAQHVVKELADLLEANGTEVKYAIHPVAGRMPGHMNVLLAEAGIPYELLVEMSDINPLLDRVDVCLVIGANDVVNPSARDDKSSPIYGMPIIEVDKAHNVFVLKRSMASGFAGIENPLFFKENTRMIFGDAKQTLQALVSEFKS